MSICARNDVIGKTRYITGSSIEGFVALNNRGGTEEEIVRENAIQIIETLEMYFITAREAFRKSEWNYKGISKVLGDAFIDLPKYLWLRLF